MHGRITRRRLLSKSVAKGQTGNLLFSDFYNIPDRIGSQINNMLEKGALVHGSKGKLKPMLKGYYTLTPWWTPPVDTARDCVRLHQVYFDFFKFVPKKCRECWKTVVVTDEDPEFQTVVDLFKLRDIFQEMALPCKCGVDLRLFTSNRYSGFIYGDTLEQARIYQKLLTDKLEGVFGNPKIIVKRGCTEYEIELGDSSLWDERAAEWDILELYLDYIIETYDVPSVLGWQLHKAAETFRFWIDYAHGIGDNTWKEALKSQGYEPPDTLFFKPKTYHEE